MSAQPDVVEQAKLVTIGYIAPVRRPLAWLPAAIIAVAVVTTWSLSMQMGAFSFMVATLCGVLGGLLCLPRFLPLRRFRWVDAKGDNPHDFVSRAPVKTVWAVIDQRRLDEGYRNEVLTDPYLGPLQSLYTNKTWSARAGDRKVFEVRRLRGRRKLAALADRPAFDGVRFEVVADPRLHPDTVERLVEKFATGHDQRQVYGYVLSKGPS
ncbi:MAG: hypothetical protein HONBIEJF_01407 [Fimbriimonadaceae bacterium]|nr:hypothetical protein [Fimbriimonadaceae bacterium]